MEKLIIISGAARTKAASNTAAIIESFVKGFQETGKSAECFYLSDRKQWTDAKKAFEDNANVLIAFPLYVENLPGILLEFLAGLTPKKEMDQATLFFLVQGGFDEASQSRCCEAYLKTLPVMLGCRYGGTLLKGSNFGIRFFDGAQKEKLLAPWEEMGRIFARKCSFDTEEAKAFAGDEYMAERDAKRFMRFGKYFMRIFMNRLSKKLGRKRSLMDRPYDA